MKPTSPALLLLISCMAAGSPSLQSTCYGTVANGRLEDGVRLPTEGSNFEGYSLIGESLGRTYVHSTVHDIVVQAYARMYELYPQYLFKYGETGFKNGGEFRPHRTHRNGLSVDFYVPLLRNGQPDTLRTNLLNKWGYNVEFDERGRHRDATIDFKAMALHLVQLNKAAQANGVSIRKVYFDPGLQNLLVAQAGEDSLAEIPFSTRRAWVRHDEHYHVDFDIPCEPLENYR